VNVFASVFQLIDGSAETTLVDLSYSVRERASVGARQGHRGLASMPVRSGAQSAAARQGAPHHLLPDAGLPFHLLRAAT
jgi:hypothetical protein